MIPLLLSLALLPASLAAQTTETLDSTTKAVVPRVVTDTLRDTTITRWISRTTHDTTWDTVEVSPVDTMSPADTTGEQAALADSLVESVGVATHIERIEGPYGEWETGARVKEMLCQSGIRYVREQMMDKPLAQQRFGELITCGKLAGIPNGIRLVGGCWPGGSFTNASRCIDLANAYGDSVIAAFDGWNEVDNKPVTDWPDKYRLWQIAQWQAYKNHPVWQTRPLYSNTVSHAADALTLFNAEGNLSGWLDMGNMHSYPGSGNPPSSFGNWITNFTKVASPKPLMVTETGYHNCIPCPSAGLSYAAHGKYIPRLYFEYWNRDVKRTHVYEFMDEGSSNQNTREDNWGLLRRDGIPKPAYTALKNLIALLTDPGPSFAPGKLDYSLSGALATTHTTLLQKRDGRFYLVLWREVKSWDAASKQDVPNADDALTLTLATPARSIHVYRPSAGADPIQVGSGSSLDLGVPDEVIVVEISR